MKILVIGSGGREHALCWAIAKSALTKTLYCAPGNGGIAQIAKCVDLDIASSQAVIDFCQTYKIDFVVIGPEAPLVNGLVDAFDKQNIASFGPSGGAAQLEGSKGFTKDLCTRAGIPTADYGRFDNAASACAFAAAMGARVVIKADGLAAGKGVIITETMEQADAGIAKIFAGGFGEAGGEVVVEEYLEGEEASFFALSDGENILPLATAQDHKRVGEGDTGPNTGGMGAYSPAPVMTEGMCERVMRTIIEPTIKIMREEGMAYKGMLYAGLMITKEGPKLIEYNCRFGDPETQVVLMRMKSDLLPLLIACHDGTLAGKTAHWHDQAALSVVMAAKGYPGSYEQLTEIKGVEQAGAGQGVEIFHAGTLVKDGKLLSAGGRVLNVTALGQTVSEARDKAYQAVEKITWPQGFYRTDIGWRALRTNASCFSTEISASDINSSARSS